MKRYQIVWKFSFWAFAETCPANSNVYLNPLDGKPLVCTSDRNACPHMHTCRYSLSLRQYFCCSTSEISGGIGSFQNGSIHNGSIQNGSIANGWKKLIEKFEKNEKNFKNLFQAMVAPKAKRICTLAPISPWFATLSSENVRRLFAAFIRLQINIGNVVQPSQVQQSLVQTP